MVNNEYGCKGLAESIIVLKNGKRIYVDNDEEQIKDQILSKKEIIIVEMTMIVSKGKKLSIKKNEIETVYKNNLIK